MAKFLRYCTDEQNRVWGVFVEIDKVAFVPQVGQHFTEKESELLRADIPFVVFDGAAETFIGKKLLTKEY